jgi:putative NIF3 family GTP cyclohydrolase 1 type 2
MALLRAVQRAFSKLAPLSLAEPWDNVGVLLEPVLEATPAGGRVNIAPNKVLLTIDLTPDVLRHRPEGTGVIVSYHPPLFRPLKSLTLADPLQASLLRCAADGIAVYSPHTSLDSALGGINDFLAEPFLASPSAAGGPGNSSGSSAAAGAARPVQVKVDPPEGHGGAGIGKIVELGKPLDLNEVVKKVKAHLGLRTCKGFFPPLICIY